MLNKGAYFSDADSICVLSLHRLPAWNAVMVAEVVEAKLGKIPLKTEAGAKDNIAKT